MSSSKRRNTRQQETKPRAKRGRFDFEVVNNRLRLVVPQKHSPTNERIRPALDLEATPENEAQAQVLVEQLNARVFIFKNYECAQLFSYIDEFFGRTKPEADGSCIQKSSSLKEPELDVIWSEFTAAQKNSEFYKETTLLTLYPTIAAHIEGLSTRKLSDHEQIFKEIKKLSKAARYRTMIYISAACNWAVTKKNIKENPFSDYPKKLGVPKSDAAPDPYTRQESVSIVEAYRKHPRYSYLADLVELKFRTACRTGEGVALKWKNVSLEEGWIYFCESISLVRGKHVATKGTKNGTTEEDGRYFKIESPKLKELLERQVASRSNSEDFVFKDIKGGHIDCNIFYYSWHGESGKGSGIIHKLVEQASVHHYRPPYNTRHTFISLAVDKIFKDRNSTEQFGRKLATLARRVGNSASMILEHYLGLSDDEGMLNVEFDEESVVNTQTASLGDQDLLKQLVDVNRQLEEANQRNAELIALFRDYVKNNSSTSQPPRGSSISPVSTTMVEDFPTDPVLRQQAASIESGNLSDIEMKQLLLFASLGDLMS